MRIDKLLKRANKDGNRAVTLAAVNESVTTNYKHCTVTLNSFLNPEIVLVTAIDDIPKLKQVIAELEKLTRLAN